MNSPKRRLNKVRVAVVLLPLLLLVCLSIAWSTLRKAHNSHQSSKADRSIRVISLQASRPDSPRRVYKYSVVPGGVQSSAELTDAAERDPVVRSHYRDIELNKVEGRYLDKDMRAYVSYRINDKVYWTRTKVQLRKGELVLTDGRNLVRGRCGNRISLAPVAANPDPGPTDPQFDIEEPKAFPVAFGGSAGSRCFGAEGHTGRGRIRCSTSRRQKCSAVRRGASQTLVAITGSGGSPDWSLDRQRILAS